jgi:hypothetical protein
VEIKGKLQFVEVELGRGNECGPWRPGFPMPIVRPVVKVWQITVNGQTYDLNFSGLPELQQLAEKLKGKTVKVLGRLEHRIPQTLLRPLRGPGGTVLETRGLRCPLCVFNPVVFVSRLEAAEGEYVRETVQVVLRGKLSLNAGFGYPVVRTPAIHVNGQWYVLNFGTSLELDQLARKLDGKTVVLAGTFGGMREFTTMCRPKGDRVRVIHVTSLQSGDSEGLFSVNKVIIKGKLFDSSIIPVPYQGFPMFTVSVKGVSYALDFDGNEALLARAKKLGRKTGVLQGVLEKKVLGDTLWKVVTVTDLKADESEYVHRTETVEIRGQLVFPTATPASKGYQGLTCLITVNGTGYWLDFADAKQFADMAARLKGQKVVVTGTLGRRSAADPVRVLVIGLQSLLELPKAQPA